MIEAKNMIKNMKAFAIQKGNNRLLELFNDAEKNGKQVPIAEADKDK